MNIYVWLETNILLITEKKNNTIRSKVLKLSITVGAIILDTLSLVTHTQRLLRQLYTNTNRDALQLKILQKWTLTE